MHASPSRKTRRLQPKPARPPHALLLQNAYFPLFITEDVLMTEKEHVEGFAPEVGGSLAGSACVQLSMSWWGSLGWC